MDRRALCNNRTFLMDGMRFSPEHAALRSELGEVVRDARKRMRIKQQALADDVGIRREALSRIEGGKHMPRSRVLDKLIRQLGIEWAPVLDKLYAMTPARVSEDGTRGQALKRLGNDIYRCRQAKQLRLRTLAKRLRISAAQLSRIERGQVLHSRIFRDHPDDLGHSRADRRIQIVDCRVSAFIRELRLQVPV